MHQDSRCPKLCDTLTDIAPQLELVKHGTCARAPRTRLTRRLWIRPARIIPQRLQLLVHRVFNAQLSNPLSHSWATWSERLHVDTVRHVQRVMAVPSGEHTGSSLAQHFRATAPEA